MKNPIFFVDPGTTESAYVLWDGEVVVEKSLCRNADVHDRLMYHITKSPHGRPWVGLEMVASYGMPVGRTTFKTVLFIGVLIELCAMFGTEARLVFRKDIKMHHCGSMRAKDGNIIQAIKDKYGGVSRKACPNPVYGGDYRNKMRSDIWQALAGALYISESTSPLHFKWNEY